MLICVPIHMAEATASWFIPPANGARGRILDPCTGNGEIAAAPGKLLNCEASSCAACASTTPPAAALKVEHQLHEQNFLIVAGCVDGTAFQQNALKQRLGRVIADRSIDLDDRYVIVLGFHAGPFMQGQPIHVSGLAHARGAPQQKVALLSQGTIGAHLGNFVVQLPQVGRDDEQEVVQPQQPFGLGEAGKLSDQLLAQRRVTNRHCPRRAG